tara:strand:+ start:792 stop:1202 length:411 start_codon:yes stop_codon:yes gene_type:complete
MKKSEFKKLIKPIIKECIQESLLEGGILSNIISEVVVGLNGNQLVEAKETKQPERSEEDFKNTLREQKQKMLDAIGADSYKGVDLFEGTEPLARGGSEGQSAASHSPLAGVSPRDPGVDIANLIGNSNKIWNKMRN